MEERPLTLECAPDTLLFLECTDWTERTELGLVFFFSEGSGCLLAPPPLECTDLTEQTVPDPAFF